MNKAEAIAVLRKNYAFGGETDQELIEDAREIVRLEDPDRLVEELRHSGWSDEEIEAIKVLAPNRDEIIREAQAKIDAWKCRRIEENEQFRANLGL